MKKKSFGLVIPLKEEADPLLNKLKISSSEKVGFRNIVTGSFNNYKVSLIISGCGKIKTASATQYLIDKCPSDFYINFGTSGAISQNLKIGDVVVATEIIEHDVKQKFPKIVPPPIYVVNKKTLIKLLVIDLNLKFGPIVSGDEDIVTTQRRKALFKKHNCLTCDWESAGFALTCQLNNVPFLVIRTVSDLAYEHTTQEYKKNQKNVVENLTETIAKSLAFI